MCAPPDEEENTEGGSGEEEDVNNCQDLAVRHLTYHNRLTLVSSWLHLHIPHPGISGIYVYESGMSARMAGDSIMDSISWH